MKDLNTLFEKSDYELTNFLKKKFWKIKELSFIGQFVKSSSQKEVEFGYIQDTIVNDRKAIYPKPILKRGVSIRIPLDTGLKLSHYYKVYAKLAPLVLRERLGNPYLLIWDETQPIEEIVGYTPPKEFIKQRFFEKGHTPSDASTIASQLSLNELELYTHTKRFIFELIQNADDMPRKGKPVHVELFLTQNHLLFLHDGKFFDREDVAAICDAAKSTKKSNITQTGYKGIGFKSVFTDSSKVYIKSGSYSFKFDKNEPIYSNFWKLYEGYFKSLNSESQNKFEQEFKGKEIEFLKIDNIPWQIKPIWVEHFEYSTELKASPFYNGGHQVAIALDVGEELINDSDKDYHKMINQLIEEPRFLLFLRNTNQLSYKRLFPEFNASVENDIMVERKEESIEVFKNKELVASYLKKDVEVFLDNENFIKAGLNFQKTEKKGKVVYVDSDGKSLDNIPEKLLYLEKTVISYAAQLHFNRIDSIAKDESILFNYLPTSDTRFGFHFLVNADFVSKTDREFIQVENKWNHYVFYNIGLNLIHWLSELAIIRIDNEKFYKFVESYLNLLPAKLLDEENEEQGSINKAFNNGLKKGLNKHAFILSHKDDLIRCEDVIIDKSEITSALKEFGPRFFKNINASDKQLPFYLLDNQKLSYNYLNIERFNGSDLISLLVKETNREHLRNVIKGLRNETYLEFLTWYDKFIKKNDLDLSLAQNIPVFKIKIEIYSINEVKLNSNLILSTSKLGSVKGVLKKMGYSISDYDLDVYNNIWEKLDAFMPTDLDLFNEISQNALRVKLTPEEKLDLINFIKPLKSVGDTRYASELKLFTDKGDRARPIKQLIASSIANLPVWLSEFQINAIEEKVLDDTWKNYLITESELIVKFFCNPGLFKELVSKFDEDRVPEFYRYVSKILTEDDINITGLKDLPWLFSPKNKVFLKSSEVYFTDSLLTLDQNKFDSVASVLHNITDEVVPHFNSFCLIQKLSLGPKPVTLLDSINKESVFSLEVINDLLDWLENQKESGFLKKVQIVKNESLFNIKKIGECNQIYTKSQSLIDYINKVDEDKSYIQFDSDLYTEKRNEIGLIEDSNLIELLIDDNFASAELIQHLNSSTSEDTIIKLILSLDSITIDTTKTIDQKSTLYKIIQNASKVLSEDKTFLDGFRKLVMIDGQSLLECATSSDIGFKTLDGDTSKYDELKIKLNNVLPKYENRTYSTTSIIDQFSGITKLNKLFGPEKIHVNIIFKELHELELKYFNPHQTLFLLKYKDLYPDVDVFKGKAIFTSIYESHLEKYNIESALFLELCRLEDHYCGLIDKVSFPDFIPKNTIISEAFALESELPPKWIKNWMQGENGADHLEFLKKLGVHDEIDPIIILRKELLQKNDFTNINWGDIKNEVVYANTLQWLKKNIKQAKSKIDENALKTLYSKAAVMSISIKNIPIPVINKLDPVEYVLIDYDDKLEYHNYLSSWKEWEKVVFKYLDEQKYCLVGDYLADKYIKELSTVNGVVSEQLNSEMVLSNLSEFNEPFYISWDRKNEFTLKVYGDEKMPYNLRYNSINLNSSSKKDYETVNGNHIISNSIKEDIPESIREYMPKELFNDLKVHKQEFQRKRRDEIHFTQEQIEAWKNLFDNDIPEAYKKNYNLASLVAALEALPSLGFEIDSARAKLEDTHEYSQLSPVMDSEGNEYLIMGRSAREGLLYLTNAAWNRLDDPNIFLFADFGYGNYNLFQNKQDVLDTNEKHTDYQILRIETEAKATNVDSILNGTFDKSKIWILFRVKKNDDYDRLFYKDYEPNLGSISIENIGDAGQISTY
ncbi:sacsin N-terminal ATP-binding-like domain-containing protein [Winogradskyella sp.]|uniref:sacsin N-terminal ATP-binding-like domain-containing protein n=1 Tax=Winogradskyella sp. TaxID=1883156 RepID=UPI003AB1D329